MGLPRGTVTLLFTDIEGSTRLLQELGPEKYVPALEVHRRLLRAAFTGHGGIEVEMQGDSFHFAFSDARAAVLAAWEGQRALAGHDWEGEPIRVRIGIHTGEPLVSGNLYAGLDVHRAARVMGAGHGGQVLVSESTRAAVADVLPDGLSFRDLGEHRLKDLLAPLRLYQLGEGEFPPLKSLYRSNLPVAATPFLGRERELREVSALLAEDEVRLVTLTGAGGTGKTRLAAQAAADASELYPDGVFWVGLASLRDPTLVTAAIAQAVGTKEELAAHVGSRRMLLLLDNLEQLLDAATGLAALLSACPGLTLLVTSRERLHLSAEREYQVPPLRESDAVSLFHERARATGSDAGGNGEVLEICRRLDHLPLAIELAAARVKVLPPPALLERLEQRLPLLTGGPRDVPERQRTLHATISWSYELLTPEEQRLFARLAVFAGGCTLEAAEHVCDADLDTLHSLVDKSLLRSADERYWMLETIREFAAKRLEESDETQETRKRHADFFAALAEQAEDGLRGAEGTAWIERLRPEQGNLRAALAWLESTGQASAVLSLVSGTMGYWYTQGAWLEGRRWLEPALARTEGERSRARAKGLRAAASFAATLGDLVSARRYGQASLGISRELGDTAELGRVLGNLGSATAKLGDVAEGMRLIDEAADCFRSTGDLFNLAVATGNLGDFALREGDYVRAEALFEEELLLYRKLGREHGVHYSLYNLAFLRFELNRDDEALSAARESLALSHRLGDVRYVALDLALLGSLAARSGEAVAAVGLLAAADAERERLGLALEAHIARLFDQTVLELREALGVEQFEAVFAEGRSRSLEQAVAYALDRDLVPGRGRS